MEQWWKKRCLEEKGKNIGDHWRISSNGDHWSNGGRKGNLGEMGKILEIIEEWGAMKIIGAMEEEEEIIGGRRGVHMRRMKTLEIIEERGRIETI